MGINDNLDVNNPSHKIVIELNNKNEELYGKSHDECSLFEAFCQCKKNVKDNE